MLKSLVALAVLTGGLIAAAVLVRTSQETRRQAFGPQNVSPTPTPLPTISYTLDKILGQPDFKETMINRIVANRAFHVGGAHVDSQDRIYVIDSGNNRILGFQNYQGPDQNADIVIGQPALYEKGTANADNTQYLPPSASTLALLSYPAIVSTAESPRFLQLTTDSNNNLYIPDLNNNRVLKYNDPFNTDQAADEVWGQPDFTSRQAHCGPPGLPPDNQTFCTEYGSIFNGRDDQIFGAAVFIDSAQNLWVADTGNSRILRFPNQGGAISKTADLVLGQPDFTTRNWAACWSSDETNRSKMWKPLGVMVDPESGELYVLDGQEPGKTNRILVFTPPFTSGMAASREFGRAQFQPNQPEDTTNWISTDDCASGTMWVHLTTGLSSARGLGLNKVGTGDLWVNDANNNRMLLYDSVGNMIEVIGQTNFDSRNCDGSGTGYQQPDGTRGPLCENYGEIGVDSQGKLYVGKTQPFRDIARFSMPLQRNANGLVIADGWLVHSSVLGEGWNQFSGKTFQNGYGVSLSSQTTPPQLLVSDGQRILVWNNYQDVTTYQGADYVVGQDAFDTNYNDNGGIFSGSGVLLGTQAIGGGYLWTTATDRIFAFALPITGSGKNYPVAKILFKSFGGDYDPGNVFWADDGTRVSFNALGIAYDSANNALWVTDWANNRVLHIADPMGTATVDLVIGQPDKTTTSPNAGQPTPNPQGFAMAWAVSLDNLGNLYVVDSKYEGGGNNRVLRFNASDLVPQPGNIFPLPSAGGVYAKKNFDTGDINNWWGPGTPQSPIWVGFDSKNRMIMLVDSYGNNQYERAFLYPATHTNETTPQPTQILPLALGQGAFAFFHPDDNHLIIQDLTWSRLSFLTLEQPTPTPTPTITSAPTPPLTPTPTVPLPTSTPTPGPGAGELSFRIRLQGIITAANDRLIDIEIRTGDSSTTFPLQAVFQAEADGVYAASVEQPEAMAPGTYDVLLKGPSHLRKKFSDIEYSGGNMIFDFSRNSDDELWAGDVNGDNIINILDFDAVMDEYVLPQTPTSASDPIDINADGLIAIDDVALSLLHLDIVSWVEGDD